MCAATKDLRRVMMSVNRLDGLAYELAKRRGLNENTLALLYALSDGRPHSQKEICDQWVIPRSTINTIVREYVASGHIQLRRGERTREKVLLLTESGKALCRSMLRQLVSAQQAALEQTRQRYGGSFVEALCFFTQALEEASRPERNEHTDKKAWRTE